MFGIECQRSEENVQFYFDDPDAARYVWKLAVLQVTILYNNLSCYITLQQNYNIYIGDTKIIIAFCID